jgi:hypothetical protein
MGHNIVCQFVCNHTSRMAPPGAVLEAYMTPTADRQENNDNMTADHRPQASLAVVSGRSAYSR